MSRWRTACHASGLAISCGAPSLAEQGALRHVIDRRYPLAQVAEAHRYVELGHKKGNVILDIGETA